MAEVQWHDRKGAELINYFPKDIELDFSLDDVSTELYDGSLALYGQDHILDAEGVLINKKNVKITRHTYFLIRILINRIEGGERISCFY